MTNTAWGSSSSSLFSFLFLLLTLLPSLPSLHAAIITLLTARYPDPEPIRRGCRLIMSRQAPDGSWPQESIEGGAFSFPLSFPVKEDGALMRRWPAVFNKNAAISYPNFKFSWSILALGKAWKELGESGW